MAVDNTSPLIYDLPDGDVVELPPWAYIVQELGKLINPITTNLTSINIDLQRIDTKLISWIDNDNT
jgi:hypothetical protein